MASQGPAGTAWKAGHMTSTCHAQCEGRMRADYTISPDPTAVHESVRSERHEEAFKQAAHTQRTECIRFRAQGEARACGMALQVAELLVGVPAPIMYWEQGHEWLFGDPVRFQVGPSVPIACPIASASCGLPFPCNGLINEEEDAWSQNYQGCLPVRKNAQRLQPERLLQSYCRWHTITSGKISYSTGCCICQWRLPACRKPCNQF